MTRHWLVNGVGRSGTTAIYEALQSVANATGEAFQFFYEPYLWGQPTWLREHKKVQFGSTSSINPIGLATHLLTPLFLDGTEPKIHEDFVQSVFPKEGNALTKVIRGCGRLEAFIANVSGIKIVHVIRNPVDTVNSVLGLFSFYGDEFHPSDLPRFVSERGLGDTIALDSTEAAKALAWWRQMGDAAMAVARRHPEQVYVLPYEAFVAEPGATLARMADFLGFQSEMVASVDFSRPAGPVTKTSNLHQDDLELLKPANRDYFSIISNISSAPINFDPAKLRKKIEAKYSSLQPGAFTPDFDRDLSPLLVRNRARKLVAQKEQEFAQFREALQLESTEKLEAQQTEFERRSEKHRREMAILTRLQRESREAMKRASAREARRAADVVREHDVLASSRAFRSAALISRRLYRQADKLRGHVQVISNPPQITCVVTSYNNGEALRAAVDSVVSQAMPPSEIIIADDASDRPSLEIARTLVNPNRGIKLIERETNVGPGKNRHLAILSAKCPFITTIDGDDEFSPAKLITEWGILKERLDAVAYSDFLYSDAESKSIITPKHYAKLAAEERVNATLLRSTALPHNMLYSKDAYIRSGGYSQIAGMYEDWTLKLRLSRDIVDWRHCDVVGLVYKNTGKGLSSAETVMHVYWRIVAIFENWPWLVSSVGEAGVLAAIDNVFQSYPDEDVRDRVQEAVGRAVAEKRAGRLARELQNIKLSGTRIRHVRREKAAEELAGVACGICNEVAEAS